jgi:hypothetical protein
MKISVMRLRTMRGGGELTLCPASYRLILDQGQLSLAEGGLHHDRQF